MTGARMIKRAGQWVVAHAGTPTLARWAHRDGLVVLTYHGVVQSRSQAIRGEASMHTEQGRFAAQLDLLCETHDVVSIGDLLNGHRRRDHRPRALITFDDAYLGAVTLGVEELAKRRIPATIFVAPAFATGRAFWWDALAGPNGGEMPHEVRQAALLEHRGADDLVRQWAASTGLRVTDPDPILRCATVNDLRAASRVPGITFAPHSWSHPVLPALSIDALRRELRRPLRWLREKLGIAAPALAVPYGFSSRWVEWEARRQGYGVVFPGNHGWASDTPLPFTLPRQNVPAGLSWSAFMLRAAGLPA